MIPLPTSVTALAYWVHDIDPVLFRIHGDIAVRWYGVAYVLGFVCGYLLLRRAWRRGRSPLTPQHLEGLMTWLVVGVLLGGRLGYMLLYDLPEFLRNPVIFFHITDGGMAFHGGAAGAVMALILFSLKNRLNMRRVGDVVAMATPPGLFFGRIANFINGELWGHPSTLPWAVVFPAAPLSDAPSAPVVEVLHPAVSALIANPRHPSQLYQAGLEGVVLGAYMLWRFWKSDPSKTPAGQIGGEFLVGYAILRMIGELFRVPDASLILGLSRGTAYSALMLLAGVGVIVWARMAGPGKAAQG